MLSAESTFSHGLGEVFTGFNGNVSVLLRDAPKDLANFDIDSGQLAHHWFAGPQLKLHIYKERAAAAPLGYVELVAETNQSEDDETSFAGTYKLTVFGRGSAPASEGQTLTAQGKASCSVG